MHSPRTPAGVYAARRTARALASAEASLATMVRAACSRTRSRRRTRRGGSSCATACRAKKWQSQSPGFGWPTEFRYSLLEQPAKGDRAPARLLALVEPVGVGTRLGRIELQMGCAVLASPVLCRIQERLADPARAVPLVDGQVLDPRAAPEADRRDVVVDSAEARDPVVDNGDEDGGLRRSDRFPETVGGQS